MNDINKRLVEVDTILKKLDKKSISKIPPEMWNYLDENKDIDYIYEYDDKVALSEQEINVDTIAILTYINMKYLLDDEQKKDLQEFLKNDELISELEKREKYNIDNIFKNENKAGVETQNQLSTELPTEAPDYNIFKKFIEYIKGLIRRS